MKVTLIVLGLTCLFGTFALPLQEETQADEVGTFLGFEPEITVEEKEIQPEIFPNFEEEEGEEIQPEVFPNFEGESEDEQQSAVWPTRRPKPPQIHDNAYRSQGPMSGRLTNVVYNRGGDQKTLQKNRIQYNINAVRRALDELLEHDSSE